MNRSEAGKLIKQRRYFMAMTQGELAEILNVTQGTVATWEKGAAFPRPKTLVKLCDVLKIPVENLLKAG